MKNNVRKGKIISEFCNLSNDIRFEELKKVLEFYNNNMIPTKRGSSHYCFKKASAQAIVLVKYVKIKKIYVKKVKEVIEMEEKKDDKN